MDEKTRKTVFEILNYAVDALKFESLGDDHYKISLSLLKSASQQLLYTWEREEE